MKKADAQCLSYFIKLKKQPPEDSMKTLFLKILQYSRENTCVKFLRTPTLKNIWVQLLLNWIFEVIVWNFVSGLHLKPSWLSNITNTPVPFKPKLSTYAVYIFNPNAFSWTQVSYAHHKWLVHKKQTLVVLGLFIKRCNNILWCVIWLDRKYWSWNCASAKLGPIH